VPFGDGLLEVTEYSGGKTDGGEVHVRSDVAGESGAIDGVIHGGVR